MQDELDFIFDVLTIINDERRKVMSELRMELFMAAAQSLKAEATLMPFPACFFDPVQKEKRFNDLMTHINAIPALKSMNDTDVDLPPKTWELLYWILTNPLTIQHVPTNADTVTAWTFETGLNLQYLSKPGVRAFLFRVVNPNLKCEFVLGKAKHGSVFAFHGSKFENFHSIVHRGLLSALNVRSACGKGSYLSNALNVSFAYTDWKQSWTNSGFGEKLKCMGICEVVKYPGITASRCYTGIPGSTEQPCMYVVDKDEYIQLSHLILFVDVDKGELQTNPAGSSYAHVH